MLNVIKVANLALSFLLELLMLVALAVWGFSAGAETLPKILLGVGAPLLAATVWGVFLAPRSARRLTGLPQFILEAVIFGLASLALLAAGHPRLGLALAVAFVINYVLAIVLGPSTETTA